MAEKFGTFKRNRLAKAGPNVTQSLRILESLRKDSEKKAAEALVARPGQVAVPN